jgi:hypothetical protein
VSDRAYICPGFQVGPRSACSFVFVPKGTNTTTAERNDTADLCGVVVVAMFGEQTPTRVHRRPDSLESFGGPTRGGPTRGGSGGAAAGSEIASHLSETSWIRGSMIMEEVAEYDTVENWAKRGVFIPQVRSGSPWGLAQVQFANKSSL